jgi:DNA-binding response OmpR family regulator
MVARGSVIEQPGPLWVLTSCANERAALLNWAQGLQITAWSSGAVAHVASGAGFRMIGTSDGQGCVLFEGACLNTSVQICTKARRAGLQTLAILPCALAWEPRALLMLHPTDFVRRPVDLDELTVRIRRMFAPAELDQPAGASSRVFGVRLQAAGHELSFGGRSTTLRKAEFGLLAYLVAAAPRGVTQAEIVQRLLNTTGDGGSARQQICELRKKLQRLGIEHSIVTLRGTGAYRWEGPELERRDLTSI